MCIRDSFNRNMENKIKDFESKHKLFFDYLLDDTWLCEKPITPICKFCLLYTSRCV